MISLQIIEEALRRADIEGLIESGAPEDEYDSEAKKIAMALEKLAPEELIESTVLKIICDIWTESFGHEPKETEKVEPCFRKIVQSLLEGC